MHWTWCLIFELVTCATVCWSSKVFMRTKLRDSVLVKLWKLLENVFPGGHIIREVWVEVFKPKEPSVFVGLQKVVHQFLIDSRTEWQCGIGGRRIELFLPK